MSTSERSQRHGTRAHCQPDLPTAQELFALLGERWNYAILREVFYGVERFGALQRNLGIAPNTLTARLNGLVEVDLLERHRYRPDKDWFDYRLTAGAREIVPAWITLSQWTHNHWHTDRPMRRGLRHRICGELITPQIICGHCGGVLNGLDLEPVVLSAEGDAEKDSANGAQTRGT
ncbi:winged helix-turn-helix transcriptional regulator [Streptomyces silvisoli]|uniref:Helix-turn-helix domain-containing protein n=1 Tax=Streptomyces silvisoli TaxID=3034235 RepID=A0ABT5ZWG7_9ACTN|nr:helix-turn-helix domain-containing protein [Streptomyces silvisoli]MDF3294170.1 helix-turn-helix domain-containing protein [Streptomyces silvisoli]